MSQEITIKELTITEIIRKNKILEAYYSYWGEDVPIKPHYELKNISNILEDAAEIASRIRNYVDNEVNKEVIFTLRTNVGTANRFLFHTENPNEDEEKFLRDLVIATLSSVDDQLESGLSLDLIESFVISYLEYKKSIIEEGKSRQSFDSYTKENLFAILKETNILAENVFNLPADEERDHNEEKLFLKSMIKLLENNYLHLLRYYRNSKFDHAIESPSHASDTEELGAVDEDQKEVTPSSSTTSLNADEVNKSRDLDDTPQTPVETVENNDNNSNNNNNDDEINPNNDENKDDNSNVITVDNEEEKREEEPISDQKNEETANVNENIDMRSSGFIKIAKIETDIENTVKELVDLRQSITDLKVDYNDPRGSLHNVEELLRKCLYWGEALMKDLLTLDSMSTDSPQASEIRPIRKKQVVQIQKLMDDLEVLKTPLRSHQTALTKIVHQLDEDDRKKKEQEDALKAQQQQQQQQQRQQSSSSSSQPKRQKKQRKDDPLSFLPEQLKNLFNLSSYDNEEENESENPLQSAAKQFADLFNQPKEAAKPHDQSPPQSNILHDQRKSHEENERKSSSPPLRNDLLDEEDLPINEEDLPIDEDDEDYEYDEDHELYLSLLRQWKLLKFEPHFETERQRGRVVITAQLPNMKEDDFKIQINERDSSLTISACRLPSREEFEYIKSNLLRRTRINSPTELSKILFRYGIHRYGTFSSSFVLPRNTLYSKIAAKYEYATLTIIAPFRVTQPSRNIPISREGNVNPYTQDDYNPYPRSNRSYAPTDFYSPNFFF